jgi:hypothetical protein
MSTNSTRIFVSLSSLSAVKSVSRVGGGRKEVREKGVKERKRRIFVIIKISIRGSGFYITTCSFNSLTIIIVVIIIILTATNN